MDKVLIKSDYQTLIYEFRRYKVMLDYDLALDKIDALHQEKI